MYKIAIAIQKGGTGKSTSTLCLGGALALMGYRTLLIDLDPQANTTSSLINGETIDTPTVHELLTDPDVPLENTIIHTSYGLDLVPSTISLALAELQLMAATSAKKLHRKLVEFEQQQNSDQPNPPPDFVLIDCPPSLGILTLNALAAAEVVIAPVNCEHYAEKGLNDFLKTMRDVQLEVNENLKLMGVLLTMYSAIKTHKDVVSYLRQNLGDKIFKTIISKRATLTEVPVRGPVQAYAPSSDSANEYKALAQEVIEYAKR